MTVRALVRGVFLYWLWLTAAGAAPPAAERGIAQAHPEVVQLFPGADRFGAVAGDPPAAPVFRGGTLLGYAFVSDAVVRIPGYSGRPINLLIGLGLDGTITGVGLLEHQETILRSHFPKGALERFVAGYAGRSIRERYEVGIGRRTGYVNVDALTGAGLRCRVDCWRPARICARRRRRYGKTGSRRPTGPSLPATAPSATCC